MIGKKENRYELIWYAGMFVFLFLWFSRIHPLVIYDADDWTYLSYVRKATPVWGEWNPARVFPEIFMPLCSRIAIYILLPLFGDLITALTVMNALVAGALITGYVWSLGNLLKRVFSLSTANTVFASGLFLIFHFLVFRSKSANNTYLFYCHDVTCYYNYLFPSLLNASLVMNLMGRDRIGGGTAKKGVLLLAVYLAVFSHLPASGILATYALCRLLLALVRQRGEKRRLLALAKQERLCVGILSAWLVCAIFELFGGNASGMNQTPFLQSLKQSLKGLLGMVTELNPVFAVLAVALFAAAVSILVITGQSGDPDRRYRSLVMGSGLCLVVMFVYIWILFTKAGPRYTYRSDCSRFGIMFYTLLILMLSFGYGLSRYPKAAVVLPLVLCILAFEVDTSDRTFLESNPTNIDAAVSAQISRDLIDQILQADRAGQTEMALLVPVSDSEDNWPHPYYMGSRIQATLFAYRLISRPMTITVVPSEEMNEKYHLPVPVPCAY